MALYVLRRSLWAGVLVLVVTLITFIIFFVIPTQRVRAVGRTEGTTVDIRQATLISGPVHQAYATYLWRLGHGSFGRSFRNRREVTAMLGEALPVTGSLVIGGAILWMLIAIPVGVLSALRPRSLLDRFSMVFVLVGISAHPVWIGLILSYLFGYRWNITPQTGYCDFVNPAANARCSGAAQWAYHMILPWVTFALLFAALYARMIRASVVEALHEDYVRTALAKGATTMRVLRAHVLRNALLPVVTMLGMDVGIAFGGTVFIETVFGLPGLGSLAVRALSSYDLPVILGVVVVVTLAIVLFNLLVDLACAVLDPRVRLRTGGDEGADEPVREPKTRQESVPQSASA